MANDPARGLPSGWLATQYEGLVSAEVPGGTIYRYREGNIVAIAWSEIALHPKPSDTAPTAAEARLPLAKAVCTLCPERPPYVLLKTGLWGCPNKDHTVAVESVGPPKVTLPTLPDPQLDAGLRFKETGAKGPCCTICKDRPALVLIKDTGLWGCPAVDHTKEVSPVKSATST